VVTRLVSGEEQEGYWNSGVQTGSDSEILPAQTTLCVTEVGYCRVTEGQAKWAPCPSSTRVTSHVDACVDV